MKVGLKYLTVAAYLAIFIFNILPASSMSNEQSSYRPPKGKVRAQARKAGGSRGCNLPLNNTVTLLVPQNHTATTVSERPIFFWHLAEDLSLPLRFTLLEPGKEPIFLQELTPKPGIVALKLPQSSPPLEIGKTYRWTVSVVCNRKKPSRNLFAQAWIERVSLPTSSKLGQKDDNLVCNTKYAQVGIWYDALSCNYDQLVQDRHNLNSDSSEFWSLLEEIDLNNIVKKRPTVNLY